MKMTHQPAEDGNKFVGNIAPPAYGSIDDHGTTGSSEHLLPPPTAGHQMPPPTAGHQMPPPTWGQMPPPPAGSQPQPQLLVSNMHPAFAQPVNDPGWRVPVANLDNLYTQLPVTGPPNLHLPQNLICPTCNHRGPTIVRLKRGRAVKGWTCSCGCLAILFLFPIAGMLVFMGFECKDPAYSCPLLVLLGVLLFALTLFCCFYPCFFRRFRDAYHHCSNCDQLLRTFVHRNLEGRCCWAER